MLDLLNSDAFGIVPLTRAVNRLPKVPGRIASMNLFGPGRGIRSKTAYIELQDNKLVLIDSAPWGTDGELLEDNDRHMVPIMVPHFPKQASITPDEVSGVREFGTEDQLQTVMGTVMNKMARLKLQFDVTWEYLYARALHGMITSPSGKLLLDPYERFGFTPQTVPFDLTNPASDIAEQCREVTGRIEDNLQGDTMTYVHALGSKEWFNGFIKHPKVTEQYRYWSQKNHPVRDDVRQGFEFCGIIFEEYRAQVGGTRFIDQEKVRFFPVGTTQTFDMVHAPAQWTGVVNTLGLELYADLQPKKNPRHGYDLLIESNKLPMCVNPSVLIEGT